MSSATAGWQELRTSSGPKCPKLFYSFTGNEDGYSVKFTDLVGFWTCVSSVADTIDYAKITRASIDPSESASQLQMLLQKLAQSLAEGTNTLRQEEGEAEVILLQTVLKLPKPLQPLKWEFCLEPRGTGELAENVLRPCLLAASESKNKLDSLHEVIKAKDHVISKLMEKIEVTTMDLSIIFPGITGPRSRKGQTTTKDAEKHVPGLKTFNKQDWLSHFLSDSPYAGFEAVGMSKLVAGCEKCPKHEIQQHDKWLSRLPRVSSSASQAAKELVDLENLTSDEDATASNTDSDDFETQRRKKDNPATDSAVIHRRSATQHIGSLSHADTATSRRTNSPPTLHPPIEQEDARSPSSSPILMSDSAHGKPNAAISKSRLGKLGSKTKSSTKSDTLTLENQMSSSPPPPPPHMSPPSSPIASSPPPMPRLSTTESRPKSSSSVATLSSLNPATPKKRRLGGIGGSKTTSTSVSASVTPEHKRIVSKDESSLPGSTQGTPRRLGRIGRTTSQLASQQTRSSPISEIPIEKRLDGRDDADASDASTASTASSASPTPVKPRDDIDPSGGKFSSHPADESKKTQTQISQFAKPPVPGQPEQVGEELTKEEKIAQRREQLKRKIGLTDTATGGGTAPGLRKKRKF